MTLALLLNEASLPEPPLVAERGTVVIRAIAEPIVIGQQFIASGTIVAKARISDDFWWWFRGVPMHSTEDALSYETHIKGCPERGEGGRNPLTVGQALSMVLEQSEGGRGALFANGWPNFFEAVPDANHIPRVMSASYDIATGWSVRAFSHIPAGYFAYRRFYKA